MTLPSLSYKVIALVIAAFAFGAVPSVYFYIQNQKAQKLLANPTEATKRETETILAAVGKLMKLPTGEEPSIATITDKDQLQSEPFFATAENGDKIIIFRNARKAILYRPSTNKIIDVAPLSITSPTPEVAGTNNQQLTVIVKNGSGNSQIMGTVLGEFRTKAPDYNFLSQGNARENRTQSILVPLTPAGQSKSRELATLIGVAQSTLPSGEASPSADILIITGSDKLPQAPSQQNPTGSIPLSPTPAE